MNRSDFLKKAGVTAAAGMVPGQLFWADKSLIPAERVTDLPVNPGFKTKHCIVVLYGNGCRKKDTVENPSLAPHMARMMNAGSVFVEDFGETANLHGYMYTELLTGRETVSEHPMYPTWTEYVRKQLGGSPPTTGCSRD